LSAVDSGGDSSTEGASHSGAITGRVMVVTPAQRIEVRQVKLGLETANLVEALSGLSEGDLVVIGNRAALEDGQPVQPKLTTLGGGKE